MATRTELRWNCWPDEADHLLLTTILHEDEGIARAAWNAAVDLLDMDAPSFEQERQFGLLARRLAVIAPDDPHLRTLRAAARRTSAQNLVNLAAIDSVVSMFDDAGIEFVVLKGVALLLSVFDNLSLRPIADLDLVVRPEQHRRAIDLLGAAGWIADRDHLGNHAVGMFGPPIAVDLHRSVSQELVSPMVSENGWGTFAVVESQGALPSGRHVPILAPTDALVHTILHGLQWNGPIVLRWVTDAAELLRSGAIDEDRLVHLSALFSVSPVIRDALLYIDEVTGGVVEPSMLRRLRSAPTPRLELLRLRAFHERPTPDGVAPPLGFSLSRFLQRTKGETLPGSLRLVPAFLMQQFEASNWRELLRKLVGEAVVRVGHAIGGTDARIDGGSESS